MPATALVTHGDHVLQLPAHALVLEGADPQECGECGETFKPTNHLGLGLIMLAAVGAEACQRGYGTTEAEWVGRYALGYGDIEQDGTLT